MTEDDAKLKWCPMKRMHVDINDDGPSFGHAQTRCIGSACMMWRWDQGKAWPVPAGGDMMRIEAERPGNGYCGLAGKP